MPAAVLLENVSKFYDKCPVANHVPVTIETEEIFALLGPNCAGTALGKYSQFESAGDDNTTDNPLLYG
ncbi:hypothetical protein [Nostoc sp. 106C]|uniref:hypothetical protein n=1 Tax=Nostoc sp. 106C TaxID=1932667 RepID=UPI000B7160B2|nr:hypothetical protein [Nostoc sp. 106C]OUL34243.1 hypothetical protein BV375_04905 [Nostoc sp. 106C]